MRVHGFSEKPQGDGGWINGGFFVLSPQGRSSYIDGDATVWEQEPLSAWRAEGQLMAYQHDGFWQPMDTLRDKSLLEELWAVAARRRGRCGLTDGRTAFWRGKRVFVTGHTGFKGSWLSLWLQRWAPRCTGYALPPPTEPSLFERGATSPTA